jgi:hypothetical protein
MAVFTVTPSFATTLRVTVRVPPPHGTEHSVFGVHGPYVHESHVAGGDFAVHASTSSVGGHGVPPFASFVTM